jgi:cytochrome P450
MRARSGNGAPTLDVDLYDDAVLADSRELFGRIRAMGSVVWLPRHRMYAIGRFDDVRAALRDDDVFRSGYGVAANPMTNRLIRRTTLASDGDTHDARRKVLMRSLGHQALAAVQGRIDEHAERVIDRLLGVDWFEAAQDFSSYLPLTVVADLVGVRADGSRLLRWAAASFNSLGPINRRGLAAGPTGLGLLLFTQALSAGRVEPGSWAASVFEARARGEITTAEAKSLVIDFVAPSLDTTILASTHLLWVLARNPDTWQQLRQEPELIARAVVENVRLGSPIRGFTRRVARDHSVDGVRLPAGARVVVLFGAANLDERQFRNPEHFDLHRTSNVQLGWGNGPHTCVGIHLAKLEMQSLLKAMVTRVAEIEVGEPEPLLNNTLQGISRLPARFTPV